MSSSPIVSAATRMCTVCSAGSRSSSDREALPSLASKEPHRVSLPELRLKIKVTGRHPWFFRKMIAKPERPLPAGDAVRVLDRDGQPVGVGFYNPRTELALRML